MLKLRKMDADVAAQMRKADLEQAPKHPPPYVGGYACLENFEDLHDPNFVAVVQGYFIVLEIDLVWSAIFVVAVIPDELAVAWIDSINMEIRRATRSHVERFT